jgi:altronate dehydratase small subunit
MANSDPLPPLIQIDLRDNVAVLGRSLRPGDAVVVAGAPRAFPSGLGLGHKIALKPIPAGGKVLKFGAPIGSATREIAAGEHVHLHNMQSDYLPTPAGGEENPHARTH